MEKLKRKSVKWEITESLLQRKEDGKYKWTVREIAEKRGVTYQNIYLLMHNHNFKRDEC